MQQYWSKNNPELVQLQEMQETLKNECSDTMSNKEKWYKPEEIKENIRESFKINDEPYKTYQKYLKSHPDMDYQDIKKDKELYNTTEAMLGNMLKMSQYYMSVLFGVMTQFTQAEQKYILKVKNPNVDVMSIQGMLNIVHQMDTISVLFDKAIKQFLKVEPEHIELQYEHTFDQTEHMVECLQAVAETSFYDLLQSQSKNDPVISKWDEAIVQMALLAHVTNSQFKGKFKMSKQQALKKYPELILD